MQQEAEIWNTLIIRHLFSALTLQDMFMRKYSTLMVACGVLLSSVSLVVVARNNTENEIKQLVRFLISDGILVSGKDSQLVPLSYYTGTTEDVAKYFGDYVCSINDSCTIVDSIYTNPFAILGREPFAILGQGLPPQQGTEQEWFQAQAQIERTNIRYGTDIYQAATWQIALALAAKNGYLDAVTAQGFVANQLHSISNVASRATDLLFKYGYTQSITDPIKAFTFRLIATNFFNKDPFFGGRYQNFVGWDYNPALLAKDDPEHRPPDFFKYVITWSDWKPLTGENAWAQLIGPLQAEYLLNNGKIPASSSALGNAINSLYAFSAMQAGIGAFYYAPGGTQGNQTSIPQGEISIENNFSVLAGLQILKRILQNTEQTLEVIQALKQIDVMLNGGTTVNGYHTLGLLSFLYNGAFDEKKGVFYTRGTAIEPSSTNNWNPDTPQEGGVMAVGVNLWGISALGVETIDNWYGEGSALKMWRTVRNNGGYFDKGELWGVGYTLNNNAGSQPEQVMSTEWTASAINVLNSLIDFYSSQDIEMSRLEADRLSMQENIIHLRNDEYLAAQFSGATPKENFITVPKELGQAYLNASKRFAIPGSWSANTLASTVSNAWVLMNKFDFNPLQYQGKLSGENYPIPEKIDILDDDNDPEGGALPKKGTVKFTAGDLGPITKLSLSYNLDGSQTNWIVAATVDKREGMASLPKGTEAISISFYNGDWAVACQIVPAIGICKDSECSGIKTIKARWSSDGKGACDLAD